MRKLCICILVLLMLAVTVSAQTSFVQDDSMLLSQEQYDALNAQLITYHNEFGVSIALVTTDSLGGKSIADFADEYYQQSGFDNDCAILVICDGEGEWYIYTHGLCANVISDGGAAQIGGAILDELQSGAYYEAAQTFVQAVAEPVCQEVSAMEAEAQQLQNSRNRMVIFGLVGGLLAGAAVAVALGHVAKQRRIEPAEKPKVPDTEA